MKTPQNINDWENTEEWEYIGFHKEDTKPCIIKL